VRKILFSGIKREIIHAKSMAAARNPLTSSTQRDFSGTATVHSRKFHTRRQQMCLRNLFLHQTSSTIQPEFLTLYHIYIV
jgi:hypothetical protein